MEGRGRSKEEGGAVERKGTLTSLPTSSLQSPSSLPLQVNLYPLALRRAKVALALPAAPLLQVVMAAVMIATVLRFRFRYSAEVRDSEIWQSYSYRVSSSEVG